MNKKKWSLVLLPICLFSLISCVKNETMEGALPPKEQQSDGKTEEQFNVSFVVEGKEVSKQTVEKGSMLSQPTDPIKEGTEDVVYEFSGWYAGDKKWNFVLDAVTADLLLSAKFNALNKYCVTFDTDGGSIVESQNVVEGRHISKPKDPVKITSRCEYVFDGWYLGDTKIDLNMFEVTESITLQARYKETDGYYTREYIKN